MSRRHSVMFTIAAFVILCCGCGVTAHADPLVLTLTNAIQSGSPGQTVTFSGSAYNTNSSASDADQIIGLGINPRGPVLPVLITDPFGDNFALKTVTGGTILGPLPIFAVEIPHTSAAGTIFFGQVYIEYFNNNAAGPHLSNLETFTITVTSPTTSTPVPEPATVLLLGAGLTGVGAAVRRRRKAFNL